MQQPANTTGGERYREGTTPDRKSFPVLGDRIETIATIVALLVCLLGATLLATTAIATPVDDGDATTETVETAEQAQAVEDESAFFLIAATDAPLDVEAGETIETTSILQNTGDATGQQTVTFEVNGEVVEETSLELEPEETGTVQFPHDVGDDASEAVDVAIATDDVTDEHTVDVEVPTVPAEFDVEITDTPESVLAGDDIELDLAVENVGDEGEARDLTIAADGEERSSVAVDLDGGESTAFTVRFGTSEVDAGELTLTVATGDATAERVVTVTEPESEFDVTISEAPEAVTAGDVLEAEATVENVGNEADDQIVVFSQDGSAWDAQPIELDAGESTTLTFEYETDDGDLGDLPVGVRSYDDSDEQSVTVEAPEPATFAVTISEAPDAVLTGESVEIEAIVENTGDLVDDQIVVFSQDGSEWDTESIELDGGESTTLTFEYETDDGDLGDLPVGVRSYDDSDEQTVAVEAPESTFDVTVSDAPETVTVGDVLEIEATVENTGDVADDQIVVFSQDGSAWDAEPIELDVGESTTLTFEYETRWGDDGELPVEVRSYDDSDGETVLIEPVPVAEPDEAVFASAASGTASTVTA